MLEDHYVWLVHDGDVAELSSVPILASIFLFGFGLLSLVGFARKNKS